MHSFLRTVPALALCCFLFLTLSTSCRDQSKEPGADEGELAAEPKEAPASSPGELKALVRPTPPAAIEPLQQIEATSDGRLKATSASKDRVAGVMNRLLLHLRVWALASPENTWALIHALLVFEPNKKLPDHDVTILDAVLAMATTKEVGGKIVPTYTGEARDGTPREPHRNQVVKLLLQTGVCPDHRFEVEEKSFTVADLVDSALWRFEEPSNEAWEHESWTLSAMARSAKHTGKTSFLNYAGVRFDGRELALRAAAHLNREMEFLEDARQAGTQIQKRREGVHGHPCGGLHLARTPSFWLEDAEIREALIPAMQRAAVTLAWRLQAEERVYTDLRRQHPSQDILITAQEMKFYGHWLETMAALRDSGIDVDLKAVDRGISLLVKSVERLDRIGTFNRMEDVRKHRVQTYRDLIGDAAHALHGLRLWIPEE